MRWNSGVGNTYRQRSCPLVITTPPASSSRNFAGRISRPLSSRRGVGVPRNIGSIPLAPVAVRGPPVKFGPAGSPCHCAPLYSTSLHPQPESRRPRTGFADETPAQRFGSEVEGGTVDLRVLFPTCRPGGHEISRRTASGAIPEAVGEENGADAERRWG